MAYGRMVPKRHKLYCWYIGQQYTIFSIRVLENEYKEIKQLHYVSDICMRSVGFELPDADYGVKIGSTIAQILNFKH